MRIGERVCMASASASIVTCEFIKNKSQCCRRRFLKHKMNGSEWREFNVASTVLSIKMKLRMLVRETYGDGRTKLQSEYWISQTLSSHFASTVTLQSHRVMKSKDKVKIINCTVWRKIGWERMGGGEKPTHQTFRTFAQCSIFDFLLAACFGLLFLCDSKLIGFAAVCAANWESISSFYFRVCANSYERTTHTSGVRFTHRHNCCVLW